MFILYLKSSSGEQSGLFHDLTEENAKELYNDYADDPEFDEVIVINGDIVACSTNPTFQDLTGF